MGFIEFNVSETILGCLENIAAFGRQLYLVLRLHPKEEREHYETVAKTPRRFHVILDTMSNHYESIQGVDVVVGISTTLLIEAAIMGRVAISVQPNLIGPDQMKSNLSGMTWAAYSGSEDRVLLTHAVLDIGGMESELLAYQECSFGRGKATANVPRLLFRLAKNRSITPPGKA